MRIYASLSPRAVQGLASLLEGRREVWAKPLDNGRWIAVTKPIR